MIDDWMVADVALEMKCSSFGRDDTDIHLYLQCLDLHFPYAKMDDIVVGFTQGVNKASNILQLTFE